jgi:Coenzyme PQQ synthesis protein D (PqqD)
MNIYEVNEPDVVFETIDGEAVVINLDRGIYFSIRGTGLTIWNDLLAGVDISSVASRLGAAVGRDVATDVKAFINRLLEEALVRPRATVVAEVPTALLAANEQYEPPTLEKYTDMEALLLLDPIHDVDEAGWPNRR